jgi:hypothetical protein
MLSRLAFRAQQTTAQRILPLFHSVPIAVSLGVSGVSAGQKPAKSPSLLTREWIAGEGRAKNVQGTYETHSRSSGGRHRTLLGAPGYKGGRAK